MNAFIRGEGQTAEELDEVLQRCRRIGWKVLGKLGKEEVQALSVWKTEKDRPAEIWAIGHW